MNKIRAIKKKKLILVIIVFSFFDALFTDIGMRFQLIEEANPLARGLYELHPIAFYAFKTLLPILLYGIYEKVERKKWIDRLIVVCLVIYSLIIIYHFVWMGLVLYLI